MCGRAGHHATTHDPEDATVTELPVSFRIPSPIERDLLLWVVRQRPAPEAAARGTVLYIHGATFPSGLAVGFKFDDVSWTDDLARSGFDVWAFDFLGYGGSSRYREMNQAPTAHGPLGRTPIAYE